MNVSQTIFLDTGVLYAFVDENDEYNLDSRAIMFHVLKGYFGSPIIIDYVVVETFLLLRSRKLSTFIKSLDEFFRSNKIKIFFVTEGIYENAMKLTIGGKNNDFLSLTDSCEVVTSKELNCQRIATFDRPLLSFFEHSVGKGYFDQLQEKDKRFLLKRRSK